MCLCTPHQQTQYVRVATLDCNDRQSVFYHRTGKGVHLCICSCLPPYLPFDSLKLLLLFVTFQTSTLTNVLCGSLHTAFALIIGGATQILPFHLQYFVVPSCMPLSRKRSVVCSVSCRRPMTLNVIVVSPLYRQEERPIWHFAVALSISLLSPVWRSVLSVLCCFPLGLRCKGTPIIWNIQ